MTTPHQNSTIKWRRKRIYTCSYWNNFHITIKFTIILIIDQIIFISLLSLISYISYILYFNSQRMENFPVYGPYMGPHIGANTNHLLNKPALSIMPITDYHTELIRFRPGMRSTYRAYADDLQALLTYYDGHSSRMLNCYSAPTGLIGYNPKTSCRLDSNFGGYCNHATEFGYDAGEPCVAVKINTVYGWIPQLPGNLSATAQSFKIKCEIESPQDAIKLVEICYYDEDTFHDMQTKYIVTITDLDKYCYSHHATIYNYWFPYHRQRNYRPPFVFVRFKNVPRDVVLTVKCNAPQLLNIDPMGGRFQMLME